MTHLTVEEVLERISKAQDWKQMDRAGSNSMFVPPQRPVPPVLRATKQLVTPMFSS